MTKVVCSGALLYAKKTQRLLLLYREQSKRKHQWGIPGGKIHPGESPWTGLCREMVEEIGFMPVIDQTVTLESYTSSDQLFKFHTFFCVIKREFIPELNHEHSGYAWASFDSWPRPLHSGLRSTLAKKVNKSKIDSVISS